MRIKMKVKRIKTRHGLVSSRAELSRLYDLVGKIDNNFGYQSSRECHDGDIFQRTSTLLVAFLCCKVDLIQKFD